MAVETLLEPFTEGSDSMKRHSERCAADNIAEGLPSSTAQDVRDPRRSGLGGR